MTGWPALSTIVAMRRSKGDPDIVHVIDEFTVGVAVAGDATESELCDIEHGLAAVQARCLVIDVTCALGAPPELARAVAGLVDRACRRGFSVAVVRPGPEVVRAVGLNRDVEFVATVDEALARVRGRLTPLRTIRLLDEPRAA
jgi:hypothetical protein